MQLLKTVVGKCSYSDVTLFSSLTKSIHSGHTENPIK